MCTVAAWGAYTEVRHLSGELPPAVAAATAVYLTLNLFVVARMIGWATQLRVVDVVKQGLGDCAPYYLFAAAMAMTVALISRSFGWLSAQLIFPSAWACYRTVSFYVTKLEERKKHLEELASVHLRTIEALAMAIEAKDENTHDHLCRVRTYVEEVGKEMKLSELEMKALLAGSLLHDIGKLAVPEQHYYEAREADPRRVREDEDSPDRGG